MNLFKRAYYSIVNNFSKSLVLFLIVFIIGNVMCGSLAISSSIKNTQNEFRKHYGYKVEFDVFGNMEEYHEDSTNEVYKRTYSFLDNVVENNEEILQYCDINKRINGLHSKELQFIDEDGYENIIDKVFLFGSSNSQLGLIKNYKIKLVEGRLFSDEEMEGSNVILVSENFRILENDEYRKVEVGDILTFDRHVNDEMKESVQYEVVGIFKRYDNVMTGSNESDYYDSSNHVARIYTPLKTLEKEETRFEELVGKKSYAHTLMITKIYLQLNSDATMNRFDIIRENLKENDPAVEKNIQITSTNDIYKKISSPIESMSEISSFLLIMSSTLCILILSVAIFILIRNRKHEIGILISLGEYKRNVILQILCEILIIGVLALGSSMITGNKLGQMYSNTLIADQIEESQYDLTVDEIELQETLLESYSFEMNGGYILAVCGIGVLVLVLSVSVPIGYIVSLKPRKILL